MKFQKKKQNIIFLYKPKRVVSDSVRFLIETRRIHKNGVL